MIVKYLGTHQMKVLLLNNIDKNTRKIVYLIVSIFLLIITLYWFIKPSGGILSEYGFSQVVYSKDKKVLRITLSKDEKYRIYTHINSSGPLIKEAVLLKEDQYFYYHPGINLISIARAINETYIKRSARVGGSTITMQVARLHYGLRTKTILGKLKQMFYALYLELYYSKDEILEAYLNLAPCGGNIEGFSAASLVYFDKELSEITLQEALFLSILPQNPSAYSPRRKEIPTELTNARHRLFELWQKENESNLTQDKVSHSRMPLNIHYSTPYRAPHFTNYVLDEYKNEKRIYTTLNTKQQDIVERLTRQYVQRKSAFGVKNAAVLLVDYQNGMEVLASLGSVDFFNEKIQGQVDGTRARRSPGSTLKPFIYALAMDQGIIHPMTMLKDAPSSFSGYAPDNYELDFKGPVKAWEALINSRNVPAVYLASKIHNPDLYDLLKSLDLGDLKPKKHYGLSIALGSAEFSMRELVSLYGILANNGVYQRVSDVYRSNSHLQEVSNHHYLSHEACWLTKNILRKNPKPNFHRLLAYGNQYNSNEKLSAISYKTGTSIGFKDCWSIGIFDKYILAVWLGNFDGYGNPIFNGRKLATPLLFEIATNIMTEDSKLPGYEMSEEMLYIPPGVREIEVCAASGQIANSNCQRKLKTHFIPGKSSIKKCEICREILINTKTGYRVHKEGKNVSKKVYEFWTTDLLRIFRKAGVPRKTPPIFDPLEIKNGNELANNNKGIAPKIISPMHNTEYFVSPGESKFNDLPLKAIADADVDEIYWFIDEEFIGRSKPGETQFWSLQPGTFQVGVLDDKGRSNSVTLKIGVAMN
jgi:penicillin-binding protein 1C